MDLLQSALTDDLIDEARAREGQKLRIEQYNHEASRDTIRHWVWGIGDDNPLYCDPDYAAAGPHGDLIAPPSFLNTVYAGHIGVGMPGIQPFGAGCKWDFYDVVRRGETITVDASIGPVKVLSGSTAPRFVLQTTTNRYLGSDGQLLATSEGRTARVPRARSEGGLSYVARERQHYTRDQLDRIRLEAVNEPRRGNVPRYIEDVAPGEVLPPVVKGPIDLTMQCAYYTGRAGSPRQKACEMAWKYATWAVEEPDRLPNEYDPTYYSEPIAPSAGHLQDDVAHELGMPGAYNNGTQTVSWMCHGITNWMSDLGFITMLEARFTRPILFYDTVWCGGTVVTVEDDIARVELSVVNQLDDVVSTGLADVRLPHRPDTQATTTRGPSTAQS